MCVSELMSVLPTFTMWCRLHPVYEICTYAVKHLSALWNATQGKPYFLYGRKMNHTLEYIRNPYILSKKNAFVKSVCTASWNMLFSVIRSRVKVRFFILRPKIALVALLYWYAQSIGQLKSEPGNLKDTNQKRHFLMWNVVWFYI
jgi:hypothetical protein